MWYPDLHFLKHQRHHLTSVDGIFTFVAWCYVQVGIGREKQLANSLLISSPTRVLLQEQVRAQPTGRRLSGASLPRYHKMHTHVK